MLSVKGNGAEVRENWTQLRVWATLGNLDWLSLEPAGLLTNQSITVLCKSPAGYRKHELCPRGLCSGASPLVLSVSVSLPTGCSLHTCSSVCSIFHIPWPEVSIPEVSVTYVVCSQPTSISRAGQAWLTHLVPPTGGAGELSAAHCAAQPDSAKPVALPVRAAAGVPGLRPEQARHPLFSL